MANIITAYEAYKSEQRRKLNEFKNYVHNVIQAFIKETGVIPEGSYKDLFELWYYNFADDYNIYMVADSKKMRVWNEEVLSDEYFSYLYDDTAFKEMNDFLEKNFKQLLGIEILPYAVMSIPENIIWLYFQFNEDVIRLPTRYYERILATTVRVMKQIGACDIDEGVDSICVAVAFKLPKIVYDYGLENYLEDLDDSDDAGLSEFLHE